MATNYPTSLDSYTTKNSGDTISEAHINDSQDAIEALEAKVGVDSSAVVTSVDYLLKNTTGGHDHDGSDSKKVDGTNILTPLGAWVDKTASYGAQQAATDGFVVAYGAATVGNQGGMDGYTDGNADPTTKRQSTSTGAGESPSSNQNLMFPVRKNDYWKIVISANFTIGAVYWIPLGG